MAIVTIVIIVKCKSTSGIIRASSTESWLVTVKPPLAAKG
ncbi:hypothetical protein PC116_g33795 [Phytophthora cactorum]|nr:hypothetical protein PC116_g33795 [Phytophthora cactorum]